MRNTGRLVVRYEDPDGTPIPTVGATGTLYVYDAGEEILDKAASNDGAGRFDLFLTEAEILAFDFRQAEYELIVLFGNGDKTTLIEGPLVVTSGRGPFE